MITGIYSETGGKRARDGPGGDSRRYNTKGRSGNEGGRSPKLTGVDRTQGNEGEGIPVPEGPDTNGKKGRKVVHAYVGYRAGIRDNGERLHRRTGTLAHRAGTSARLVLAIGDPRSPNAAPRGVRTSTLHQRVGSARVRRAAAAQAKLRRGRPTRALIGQKSVRPKIATFDAHTVGYLCIRRTGPPTLRYTAAHPPCARAAQSTLRRDARHGTLTTDGYDAA